MTAVATDPNDNRTLSMPLDDAPKNKPGRKPLPSAQPVTDVVDPQVAAEMSAAANELIVLEQQANERATALAVQLEYDGSLAVGSLEDEIRFFQRRTVEALLETGKRLLILREVTGHGEFLQRVELLGFSKRTAQRFMQAALKTSKSAKLALLSGQVKNSSAFLELITHDDDVLDEVAEMDGFDTMSATEMRSALREKEQQIKAKDRVISDKNERIDGLEEKLHRPWKPDPESIATTAAQESALKELNEAFLSAHLSALRVATIASAVFDEFPDEPISEHARECVDRLVKELAGLASTHNINVDLTIQEAITPPAWLSAKAVEAIDLLSKSEAQASNVADLSSRKNTQR